MSNFEKSVSYTITNEGPYSNDPKDPGGATNWGIIEDDLAQFRGKPVTVDDMKALTVEEAKEVYHKLYWLPLGLDSVKDDDIATCVFDMGVNRGLRIGTQIAQEACRISVDGRMGDQTHSALNSVDKLNFIVRFATATVRRYVERVNTQPSMEWALSGWSSRAMRLLTLIPGVLP